MGSYKYYVYEGPVTHFGKVIQEHYVDSTTAYTEKRARSNIAYHFNMKNGYGNRFKISLPGKLTALEGKDIYTN